MPIRDNKAFKVAVYVADQREQELATKVLSRTRPDEVHMYSGVVTGWITKPLLKKILKAGLAIEDTTMSKEQARSIRLRAPKVKAREFLKNSEVPILPSQRRGRINEGSRTVAMSNVKEPSAAPPFIPFAEDIALESSYLVRFSGPMRPAWLDQIKSTGLELLRKVGQNTYRMFLTPFQLEQLQAMEFFVGAETDEPKQTPGVVRRIELAQLRSAGLAPGEGSLLGGDGPPREKLPYDVSVYRETDLPRLKELLENAPEVDVVECSSDTIRFRVNADSPMLAKLSQMDEVKLLADHTPPALFCSIGTKVIGLTALAAADGKLPWTGEGEVIGVLDSGVDDMHPDLRPAIAKKLSLPNAVQADTVGHGTHVAGIIAGRGIVSNGAVRGAAPAANLVVLSMIDADGKLILPVDYRTLFDPLVAEGARILNMSWGWPIGGSYDQGSAQVDKYIYENPEVLMVIAAGNSGSASDGEHALKTIGAPASAKNCITVGACRIECDKAGCPNKELTWGQKKNGTFPKPPAANEKVCGAPLLPAAISSRGPTDFESIKPDVLAPGVFIESTKSHTFTASLFETACMTHGPQYACCTGTSMAAPFVSAAAALLRQYLREERQVARPSAALLKALLVASARRVPAVSLKHEQMAGYPDYDQGFGVIDLSTILPNPKAAKERKLFWADVANNSMDALASRMPPDSPRKSFRTYSFTVPADAIERVRIVLCWTDRPGVYLQNNLHLDVRLPNGSAIVGNHDNKRLENPLFDDLNIEGVAFDKRNNVEMVHIDHPQPGEYRVRVLAQNTPYPNQGYALVVSSESSSLSLA